MVARNEIYWTDLGPPAGRRPVCVLTRDAAAAVLTTVTCAPITRTVRGIRSEVEIGTDEGLPEICVIKLRQRNHGADFGPRSGAGWTESVAPRRAELDRALRFALDIVY